MSKLNVRVLTLSTLAALAFAVSAQAATAPSAETVPILPAQTAPALPATAQAAPAKSQPKPVRVKTTKRAHHLRKASVQKHHASKVVRHRHQV